MSADVTSTVATVAKAPVGFLQGLGYTFRGAHFLVLRHPGLIRIWIWPILVTLACVVLVFGGSLFAFDDLANWLWPTPDNTWLVWLHRLVELVILLLLWVVGVFVVIVLSNILSAPFHDLLSERVEHHAGGLPAPPFSVGLLLKEAARSISYEVMKLLFYLAALVPILLLNLIPLVGHAASVTLSFALTTYYLAVDYIDWPAARRKKSNIFRFGLAFEHPATMFGFGCGVWLFLFVPVVNLLLVPAAVAGGTLLFLDLERQRAQASSSAE